MTTALKFPVGDDRVAQRLDRTPLVLLLDIDGTLAPIAARPEAAAVPDATRAVLRALVDVSGVTIAAVTGRSAPDGMRMLAVDDAWVIGNHGMELLPPGGMPTGDARAIAYAATMAEVFSRARAIAASVPGSISENKGWSVSVHYRQCRPEDEAALLRLIEQLGADTGMRVLHGKKVVELRPPIDVNKGTASIELAERIGADRGAVLYAGDDTTDEEAFAALRAWMPAAVTIRVGHPPSGKTNAEFLLATTDELRDVLAELLRRRRAG